MQREEHFYYQPCTGRFCWLKHTIFCEYTLSGEWSNVCNKNYSWGTTQVLKHLGTFCLKQKAKVSATEEWCGYLRAPAICKSSRLHLHTSPSRIKEIKIFKQSTCRALPRKMLIWAVSISVILEKSTARSQQRKIHFKFRMRVKWKLTVTQCCK